MRIALVAEFIDRRKGGAETSVMEMASHLAAAGVDVTCLSGGGEPAPGVKIRPIGTMSGPRWWRYWRFLEQAATAIRQEKFDLVHAIVPVAGADIYQPRGGTVPETLARNLALVRPGWRRVLKRWQQAWTLKQRVMRRMERNLLVGKDKPIVACVSDYVARQVEQHYGLSGPGVRVIFNGVNPDPCGEDRRTQQRLAWRQEWGFDADTVVFVTVAHNFRLKGVHRFLQAAAVVRQSGRKVGFVVAGRGRDAPCRRLAERCGIDSVTRFTGPVSDVWGLYHAGDACVLASYYDPCSRVVLEALSAGLPCVTTRYNGASDLIEDGGNGYVVASPDDVAALIERMRLLLDEPRRRRMGEAGRALRDQVSMARHIRQMLGLYEEVFRGKCKRVGL